MQKQRNDKHMPKSINHEKKLWMALSLTSVFIVIELIGSVVSHSLTLLSDAAHLFTDAAALIISITAMRLGRRQADQKRTFGYYRIEILAAAFNASTLFMVAGFIFYMAYKRFFVSSEIHTTSMIIVASIGVVVNFISIQLLKAGSKESLNIKSAYLDSQADLLSSLGVILTAFLIRLTEWQHLDSLMAIGISLWILPRTWLLLKESINILLEGVPEGIELAEISHALLNLPGVSDVHDLHVWALTNGKISLTAHMVIGSDIEKEHNLLAIATDLLEEKFNVTHSTIQIETTQCYGNAKLHL
ncbi:MAG TPA: cation diffusion facilitator family transporter [Gammaproteobacteria bacterium]|nr:cation diffusion facilitator family transporter [Gammaproteobacteria bacterium]